MKRIFASAFVILLTVGAAQAQTTSTEKHHGHKKEHKMAYEKLNLTADQKARVQAIREEHKKQFAELKNNKQLSAEQLKARKQELHQQHRAQVDAILTKEQIEQLEKYKAERKAVGKTAKRDFKGKNGEGRSFHRDANLQQELGLTEDQQAKMQQIRTDFHGKLESLRSDNSLTQEQRKAKMQDLMKQQQEQMKTVLTKEQQEKMQSLKKERSSRNTK